MNGFDETRRAVLGAVADTIVPSRDHQPDPDGFWARSAGDVGVPQAMEQLIAGLPGDRREGLLAVLDSVAEQGFIAATQPAREQILRTLATQGGPLAAAGVGTLIQTALFLHYGLPDPASGQNPAWRTFGYPGPVSAPPAIPKPITPLVPEGRTLELDGDVVVVGSGAGGGVIAGTLAQQGLRVVVLEAGGYFNEADFDQLELPAYQRMYWRGGGQPTANFDVTLMTGATLGGGTRINWTNCLRTPAWVRAQWAREYGLRGVDGPDFDAHLDAVLQRISANDRCSDLNGPHQRMKAGAEALGWSFVPALMRNVDPQRYDPVHAGYMGFGEQSGAKQDTASTYLVDAFDAGAQIVTHCFTERVLLHDGHAAGVEGTWTDPHSGRRARVVVRARQVVVACGAIESAALLLRSALGGPAVGRYLRVHPVTMCLGLYEEDQRAWWGAPMTAMVDEFADVEDGYGFLIQGMQYAPGLIGSVLPFTSAGEHRAVAEQIRYGSMFIGLLRDHGSGQVSVDACGQAVADYALTDELDVRNTYLAMQCMARLHHAAGAREIRPIAAGAPCWRRGENLEAFLAGLTDIPLRFGGVRLFSAHIMGTCRMGTDPATSVAGPWGELHDTPGVWIGDGSALPTPSGTNPMISIMALARRTARAIAAATTRSGTAVPV